MNYHQYRPVAYIIVWVVFFLSLVSECVLSYPAILCLSITVHACLPYCINGQCLDKYQRNQRYKPDLWDGHTAYAYLFWKGGKARPSPFRYCHLRHPYCWIDIVVQPALHTVFRTWWNLIQHTTVCVQWQRTTGGEKHTTHIYSR